MIQASDFLTGSFTALAVLVAALLPLGLYWAHRRLGRSPAKARRPALTAAAGAGLWMALTGGAAVAGWLSFTTTPPTMVPLLLAMAVLAVGLGVSRVGERLATGLPLAALVAAQGFRLPLELLMHRAYEERVMPVQMSFSGLNFDIVTGITALVVAGLLAAGRMPPWGVRAWNWLGIALLVNIVAIAILSAPLPFRVFMNEPANVWVTQAPFVWLPTVMVLAAVLGHIVVHRRLRVEARLRAGAAAGEGSGSVRNAAAPALHG